MDPTLAAMRQEYTARGLREEDVVADPMEQFDRWFEDARRAKVYEPNAMTLASVSAEGQPSARMVLLKIADRRGLAFFTNLCSRKARELEGSPRASLLFWWGPHRAGRRRRGGRLLRQPAARQPARRMGLGAERGRRRAPCPGRGGAPPPRALRGRRCTAAAVLGRLQAGAGAGRVLAGPAEPTARSPALHERRERVADRTPRTLSAPAGRDGQDTAAPARGAPGKPPGMPALPQARDPLMSRLDPSRGQRP
jgi:hypothetical protein